MQTPFVAVTIFAEKTLSAEDQATEIFKNEVSLISTLKATYPSLIVTIVALCLTLRKRLFH